MLALLGRGTRNFERVLNEEPFLEGREDEEVLKALIVFDVVRGQESTNERERESEYRYVWKPHLNKEFILLTELQW